MPDLATIFIAKTVVYSARLAWIFPAMTLLEWWLPVRPQAFKPRLQSLVFWIASVPITGAAMTASTFVLRATGWHTLIEPRVWFGWNPATRLVSLVVAPVLGAIVGDFFFYWGHRAEHAFFWRFHRVHHSITELNVVNSYHHITEEWFRTVLMVLPSAFIFSLDVGPTVPVVGGLLALSGFYVHSSVRFHLGPLTRIFCDNRFHRIHHSTDPSHHNKNFCAFSTIWDQLFGTAYFPKPGEWPTTGLSEFQEPQSFVDWIGAPLKPLPKA